MLILQKMLGAGAMCLAVAGCAAPDPFALRILPTDEQIDVRSMLAQHPHQKACVEYQAATNSCASIITSHIRGNTLISREIGAVRSVETGVAERVVVNSRSTLRDGAACVQSSAIAVTGPTQTAAFLQDVTRDLIDQFGGSVCGTYYRAGAEYVVRSIGANGQPFPPGDIQFRFVTGEVALRAQ